MPEANQRVKQATQNSVLWDAVDVIMDVIDEDELPEGEAQIIDQAAMLANLKKDLETRIEKLKSAIRAAHLDKFEELEADALEGHNGNLAFTGDNFIVTISVQRPRETLDGKLVRTTFGENRLHEIGALKLSDKPVTQYRFAERG